MECQICHKIFPTYASCKNGHYVCDQCHAQKGVQVILEGCKNSSSKNPIALMQELMENPFIYMHGPEHHILVGAALLTACHNCGATFDMDQALEEMKSRGSQYPGGSCGLWGCCGAAVSVGMFISILTKATPLTGKSWVTPTGDRPGAQRPCGSRRPALLQAEFLYRGKGSGGLCRPPIGDPDGASRADPMRFFRRKQAVSERPLPLP